MAMNHIWKEHGPLGFFNGLVPRLVGETLSITILGFVTYLLKSRKTSEEASVCIRIALNVSLNYKAYV